MINSQVSEIFLNLALDAGIKVSLENEIYLPLSNEDVEKLYETLLEPNYSNLILGEIFEGLESSKKNLYRIGISVRSTNALMRVGVNNLQDLSIYTLRDVNDFRNLGSNSLYEIMTAFLRNLTTASISADVQSVVTSDEVVLSNPVEKYDNQIHITGIPEAAIIFLNEISIDLSAKDLHIINTRSEISQKISHREVAEDWGVTRQRIHQIENRLRIRFRSDKNLNSICYELVPEKTYVGVSELLGSHPWLNLGVAIHPIGVSIFNILVFSKLIDIHDDWLVQNSNSPISDLIVKIHEGEILDISHISEEARISEQVKVFLESKLRVKAKVHGAQISRIESVSVDSSSGLSAADLWLQEFHRN
jgi:hypothetical protein